MLSTLPAAPTLGTMSIPDRSRPLELVEVPPGPAAIEALWGPLDAALAHDAPIAPIPRESASLPAPLVRALRDAVRPEEPVPHDTAVVISTSGSTGHPRGVMLGAHALTAATAQVHSRVEGEPIWVLALPPTSIGGLNVMIRAHNTGIRPIAVRSIGGAEPFTDHAFATAVREATATGRPIAVSLVPSQVTRLLASAAGQESLRQCSLTLVGGGPVDPQLPSHCQDAGITLTTTYGMTETSGGCVFDGRPLDGVEVRIDDADSRVCVSGPMLAQGYRDGDNRAFDGHWLRTNDRGTWKDGLVSIDGRLDDIVSLHGVNVDLAAVQERVDQHPRIEASLIIPTFGQSSDANTTDEPRIAMVYVGEPVDHEELRAWISPTLGAIACPTVIRRVDTLTRTLTGKVDRQATAASAGLGIGTSRKEGAA